MPRQLFALLIILATASCESDGTPLPTDEPFAEVASELSFGMFAADLRERRPDIYLSGDGTDTETIFGRDFSYLLTPKEPDRPAPPTARLVGIQSRMQYWDTLELRSEWSRLLRRYSAISGTSPECATVSDGRTTWTRGLVDGDVVRRLTEEIVRGPDGQSFEAYLVARISVGAFEEAIGHRRTWTRIECPAAGVHGIDPPATCPRCELRLDTLLTLGAMDGPGAESISAQSGVAIDALGRILVGPAMGIGRFAVFSPDGRFLRYVGRHGEGPGEYRFVFDITAAEQWIHVFDPMLGRRTMLDTAFNVIRTDRVPGQVLRPKSLEAGRVAFFGDMADPDHAGRLIHTLDPDGTMRSLARPEGQHSGRLDQHAFGTDGRRAWTAPTLSAYTVSEWSLETGVLSRTMSFDSEWFSDWNDGGFPASLLIDLQSDDEHLLVIGATVDARMVDRRIRPGTEGPPQGPLSEVLDGVIELIDLESETVLAHLRVDGFVQGFVYQGWLVSIYRETPAGIPLLDIARVTWAPPP